MHAVIGCGQAVHVLQTDTDGTALTKHHGSWACVMSLRLVAAHACAVQVQAHIKLKLCTLTSEELLKNVKGAAIGLTASHTPHTALQPCLPIPVATFSSSVMIYAIQCSLCAHLHTILTGTNAVSCIAAQASAGDITVKICQARHTVRFG